jgi:hypothetical protein
MAKKNIGHYKRKRSQLMRKLSGSVEMLQGSLVKKYVRCGKENCRCVEGEGHGPVFYLSFKEVGRTKLVYVPSKEVEKVKQQLASFKQYKEIGSEIAKLNMEILKIRKGNG